MHDSTREELDRRISSALVTLSEFADTVQILASKVDDEAGTGNTVFCNCGTGNVYARIGQAREWVIEMDERAREEVRNENRKP